MHPAILSRHMFNILSNVMIRPINYERFNTNDDEYVKLVVGMRRATFEVSDHSIVSPPRQSAIFQVYHGEVAKCFSATSMIHKRLLLQKGNQ